MPFFAALALLFASGLVHGLWTQRWHASEGLENALPRVSAVPMSVGTWQAVMIDVEPEPFEQAGAIAYWMRRYTNQAGESISVILMCGQARRMAVHTPDICYRGAGYEMVGVPEKYLLSTSEQTFEFSAARFRLPGKSSSADLAIYWAWGADDSWLAPATPRLAFGGQPYLYKLYVVRESSADPQQDAVAASFLRQLMPQLQAALFSARRIQPEL